MKIKRKIDTNADARGAMINWGGYRDKAKTIDYQTFNNAAGNHLFDDHPEIFDITENEGHSIRVSFQSAPFEGGEWKKELISWGVITK